VAGLSGVGGNSQPGALIALFVFCALAALKRWRRSLALSSIWQVIASARRITQITDQQPEVTFVEMKPVRQRRWH
jgi:ATP-binding cassette subfamily C protein CydC